MLDFAVPADHKMKIKESEKQDKYLDLAWELKNNGTWKTVRPIVVGALETIPKGLVNGPGELGKKKTCRDHPDDI